MLIKGKPQQNHLRNAFERKLNKSKDSRKRCHNVLNKGYEYKFSAKALKRNRELEKEKGNDKKEEN